MRVITDLSQSPFPDADPTARSHRSVITIGAYDGVHLGHQAIIAQVRRGADQLGAQSVVLTFDRHPAEIVRPESAPHLLTDLEQKLELLEATGIDATVLVRFDENQANEEPQSFVSRVLVDCLGAQRIVVGDDFHFGSHRQGNVTLLRELGQQHDFDVEPLELLPREDGVDEPISSTAIRRALAGGQVELAAVMLGRPFQARGVVVRGDQRGRLLGFPTANVEVPNAICLPADGVYAGWYLLPDGHRHPVRDQPRPTADVLRARRPLVARGAPARLRRRSVRAARPRRVHALPAQRAQVRRDRVDQDTAGPRRPARAQSCCASDLGAEQTDHIGQTTARSWP